MRLDSGSQFLRKKRFFYVITGPQRKPLENVLFAVHRRDKYNRRLAFFVLPDFMKEFISLHIGKYDIQQYQIRLQLFQLLERSFSRIGLMDLQLITF